MTSWLIALGVHMNMTIVYFAGRVYLVRRMYMLNGGALFYTERGEVYVNPDGREVWA